jgi:sugar (pentulose or hexulose) kinase
LVSSSVSVGIDVGTTGVKGVAVDDDGVVLAVA